MRSVITLITLGVDDHGIGPALGLWPRAALAEDSGVAQDSGGHRWEIAHNPFWPLDEDGRSVLPE